jgi:ketosteroid isomerase-like protein
MMRARQDSPGALVRLENAGGRYSRPAGRGAAMTPAEAVTVATLEAVLAAFNRHDIEAIMAFFTEDATIEMPRGADPWGSRCAGKAAVREGLAARFSGIPDVRYSDDRHWVCGDRGVSEWLLTGATTTGERIAVRGCDLWEFHEGRIRRKDSYWKIVG